MIVLKTGRELKIMKEACSISAGALEAAGKAVEPGVTTAEIDRLAEEYIRSIEEKNPVPVFAVTTGRTFLSIGNPLAEQQVSVLSEEGRIIQEMAEKSDCVIVGRRADYILRDKNPLKLFIYADMDFKMQRCREWEHFGEEITDKALRQKIISVDKERAKYYEFMTGQKWGDKANYDICLNTSALGIEKAVESILALLK